MEGVVKVLTHAPDLPSLRGYRLGKQGALANGFPEFRSSLPAAPRVFGKPPADAGRSACRLAGLGGFKHFSAILALELFGSALIVSPSPEVNY